MRTFVLHPVPYGKDLLVNNMIFEYDYLVPTFDLEDPLAKRHIALERGPLMLAVEDSSKSKASREIEIETDDNLSVSLETLSDKEDCHSIFEGNVKTRDGDLHIKDYASAGKDKKKEIAVWILTK